MKLGGSSIFHVAGQGIFFLFHAFSNAGKGVGSFFGGRRLCLPVAIVFFAGKGRNHHPDPALSGTIDPAQVHVDA